LVVRNQTTLKLTSVYSDADCFMMFFSLLQRFHLLSLVTSCVSGPVVGSVQQYIMRIK